MVRSATKLCSSVGVAALMVIAGCSDASEAQGRAAPSTKGKAMTETQCADDMLSRSACMIRMILDDVERFGGGESGGGISDIKATSSTSYVVSMPKEERIQQLKYEFTIGSGTVKLKARTETTQSF